MLPPDYAIFAADDFYIRYAATPPPLFHFAAIISPRFSILPLLIAAAGLMPPRFFAAAFDFAITLSIR